MFILGIPFPNLLDENSYRQELESLGFKNVEFEFLDQQVFEGFSNFVTRHDSVVGALVDSNRWKPFMRAGSLLGWISRKRLMRYFVVKATV